MIVPVQHHAPAASACGNSCGASCCDDGGGIGHRLRGRLHGLFNRGHGNDCCEQVVAVDCCDSGGHRRGFGHRRNDCDTGCDDGCGKPGLLDRIRGMFHRDRGCCADTCCGNGAHPAPGGTVIVPGTPPGAEPLKEQPKKLPNKPGAPKQTRVITPTVETPIAPALQDAPAINAPAAPAFNVPAINPPATNAPATNAPAIAPRIIERNPF
jgi:hypothetical protein